MRRNPSLTSLRLFMLVARHSSFSEAGRIANVSQPALSRTIRLLEEELGSRLFDRNSRNVALTSAGQALLPIVARLTADFDEAFCELAQTLGGERGRVVIGALPSVAAGLLPRAMAGFRATHPYIEIVLQDHLSGALYDQMEARQIDLAITTPPGMEKFSFDPLFQDAMVLAVRAGSGLDTGEPASWDILAKHPFIAMADKSSVRELTNAAMIRASVSAKPLYGCTQIATVGGLIEADLGITALPRSTLGMLHSHAIAWRPLKDPVVERMIGVARLAGRTLPPAAQIFLEYFLDHAREGRFNSN